MRKFTKDRSMARPGNASFTGKPTVFTRFWLRYSSGVLKNSREEARTNDSFERHCRDSFQASLEICAFRGKKSVFLPLLPLCFRPCFYSSPSRRRRVAVFPPVNKSRSIPLSSPFFSFFLSATFFFFSFFTRFFLRFLVSFPLCNSL